MLPLRFDHASSSKNFLLFLGFAWLLTLAASPFAAETVISQRAGSAQSSQGQIHTQIIEKVPKAGSEGVVEAAASGRAKTLEILLSRGAPADAVLQEEYGSKPRRAITLAAAAGSEEAVALLLRYGASPNSRNEFPYSFSLHGSSPSRDPGNHKSALMYAAEGGHAGVVQQLLKAGAKPNAETVYGETALMFAAGRGHAEVVRALIQGAADMNTSASEKKAPETRVLAAYGGTALLYAVRHAYTSVAKARVKDRLDAQCREHLAAADVIAAAYQEKKLRVAEPGPAVGYALACDDLPLLSMLVAAGAVQAAPDALLLLGWGFNKDTPEAAQLLIRAGANVNARAERPWDSTPLMKAAYAGANRTVQVLLDAGAEINAANTYGETALWFATKSKSLESITLLLARGANPNAVTQPDGLWFSKGGAALNLAAENACVECAKALLARGADPRIPDSSGKTPADALRREGLLPR